MPTKAPPSAPGAEGPVLTGDRKIAFPEFFILSASAGAGKTHALSLRFVQFLLSGRIRELTPNDLPNIMAMTFTRNAAREMKERILGWLKECSRGDARRIKAIQDVVSAPSATLERLAGETVDRILDRYSDFQVDTIDHFTGAVFRASAVDLGVSPDFETILEPSETISYAFSRYLRKIRAGSPEGAVFERILELLFRNQPGERPFDWDPAPKVREYINNLSGRLAAQEGSLVLDDLDAEKEALERQMREAAEELGSLVESAGLEKRARGHCFSKIIPAVSGGDFAEVIKASFKSVPVSKPVAGRGSARGEPGRGSKSKAEGAVPDAAEAYERVMGLWGRLESLVKAYRPLYARSFYHPYLMAYQSFLRTLEQVKRQRGVVFIDDINHKLSRYLDRGLVPDIYFRLGDRVFHFLIDEFQDTSPIQWKNLIPLIENSLAQAGSLFVVGDTKQAIYGFRDADYRIMADLEQAARRVGDSRDPAGLNPFLSVAPVMGRLETNYRSRREILDFVKDKFLVASEAEEAGSVAPGEPEDAGPPGDEECAPEKGKGKGKGHPKNDGPKVAPADKAKYAFYLKESGLADFKQHVDPRKKEPGHVEYTVLERRAGERDPGFSRSKRTRPRRRRSRN
jgi:ATP-dependent helicase/nuclease subunit A